jgi:hypothetical protein
MENVASMEECPSPAEGPKKQPPSSSRATLSEPFVLAGLTILTAVLALKFLGWPLNRDITEYAVTARELLAGERLYSGVWNIKPPAIFATYMLAQELVPAQTLQVLVLDLLPTIVVLAALFFSSKAAGFGRSAAAISALLWVALSNDTALQTHEPNTEIFINACTSLAFLQLLRLRSGNGTTRSVSIGLLFALAALYKTVALATAVVLGFAYVIAADVEFRLRLRNLALMAASGAAALACVIGYFSVTGRFEPFREAMLDSSRAYAGSIRANLVEGFLFVPIVGNAWPLNLLLLVFPWALVAVIAARDRKRRGSWVLLGAFGFGSLVATSMPGQFYAHYYQLLIPPFCLGAGWLFCALREAAGVRAGRVVYVFAGVMIGALFARALRIYPLPPEQVVAGRYQERYLVTERLGRRLASVLHPHEVLYQWGNESGLYWFSERRPPSALLAFFLTFEPQGPRLTTEALQELSTRPPDVIVAANSTLEGAPEHPVTEWILANYFAVEPTMPEERRFFTFFLHTSSSSDLGARLADMSVSGR